MVQPPFDQSLQIDDRRANFVELLRFNTMIPVDCDDLAVARRDDGRARRRTAPFRRLN
jgi:hypothetical protein